MVEMTLGLGIYLCFLSIEDLETRRIAIWKLVCGFLFLLGQREGTLDTILPGIAIVVFSIINPQNIGMGDGIILLLFGMLFEGRDFWQILGVSACIIILYLIFVLGKGEKVPKSLPGIPVLTMGYLLKMIFVPK